MYRIILLSLLLLPSQLYSQTDSQTTILSISFDTTWNHSILESDLLVKLRVDQGYYITDGGSFQCTVLAVIKGEYKSEKIRWSMGLIEFSSVRWYKRFDAISRPDARNPYEAYVGFKLVQNPLADYPDFTDPLTGKKYSFFMSNKNLEQELRDYLRSKFMQEKLWPFLFYIPDLI